MYSFNYLKNSFTYFYLPAREKLAHIYFSINLHVTSIYRAMSNNTPTQIMFIKYKVHVPGNINSSEKVKYIKECAKNW